MRIKQLDYLRGLSALSILVFHYTSWSYGEPPSSSFIGKIGFYGVSIFYVLSGLTLYLLYNKKLATFVEIKSFFIKRIFRIYPLLIFVTLIYVFFSSSQKSLYDVFINVTGLFGFIAPHKYIASGAWSIGNELVFYCFFPFFIFSIRMNYVYFYIVFIISLLIAIYFAFWKIDSLGTITTEWNKYVNPFNQLFLFTSGIFIGILGQVNINAKLNILLIAISILLFTFLPVEGESIKLFSGTNRVILSFLSIEICFLFYCFQNNIGSFFDKILSFLGEVSYSLYMIHPVIFTILSKVISTGHKLVFCVAAFIFSAFFSYFIYIFIEKPFMKIGKNIASKA